MAHYPKPFFRAPRGLWYVQIDGKQINLGPAKRRGNGPKLIQGIFKVLNDLLRQYVGVRESAAVLDAVILDPDDVQAHFVVLE